MDGCTLIENLRTPRIFGMAVFDWVATYLGAYVLAFFLFKTLRYFNLVKSKKRNFKLLTFWTFIALVGAAVYLHDLLGVSTMLGYYLGFNGYPEVIECFNLTLAGMSSGGLDVNDPVEQEPVYKVEPIEPMDPHHPLYHNPFWFMDY